MEYGLIGKSLKHSYSSSIHQNLNLYQYELKELSEEELSSFILKKEFKGLNVTIPYKEKVIPYLDELSLEAKKIGAVNCVVNVANHLKGYNTDYFGFIDSLNHFGIEVKDKTVLILGSGGASKAVDVALNDLGAKTYVVSRNPKNNQISYLEASNIDAQIIVNATPVGMYPNNDDIVIYLSNFMHLEYVIDLIYNPNKTALLLEAESKNIKAINGLYMLVSQAIKSAELFVNKEIDDSLYGSIYSSLDKNQENIVLIGMPGSGKSNIAKLLARRLNRKLVDIDVEIINRIKMDISTYFDLYGEEAFREVESDVIKEVSKEHGLVIATGGGVVTKEINILRLKSNGKIYFINRDLPKLEISSSRPLSSSFAKLKGLYDKRIGLYRKYQDATIDNNRKITFAVEEIMGNYL